MALTPVSTNGGHLSAFQILQLGAQKYYTLPAVSPVPKVPAPVTASPTPVATPQTPITGTLSSGTVPVSAADTGSGGAAMSGVNDLFSGIGTFLSDLTHPGTTSGPTPTTPSSGSGNLLLIAGLVLVVFLVMR